jgi:hypothetical protein
MGKSLSEDMETLSTVARPTALNPPRSERARLRLFRTPLIVATILALLSLLTANAMLTILSIAVALIVFFLLWRPEEPPVLLFACAIQWIQITTVLHYANFAGATLIDAFGGPQLQWAVLMGLIGLLCLALGARIGMGKPNLARIHAAQAETKHAPIFALFVTYIIALTVVTGSTIASNWIGPIKQLLISVVTIKWMILFLLFYVVLQRRRHYSWLWVAVGIEFSMGLLSYFSQFKNIFFLLIVVLLGVSSFWNFRRVILGGVVCGLLLVTSIVWSAIKQDYREFLNQGSKTQEVLVPVQQRLAKITDLATDLTDEGFFQGVDTLIARVSYVTYFAMAIDNVPDRMPYENGRLWRETVQHVFMPRLFFPNKPVINDSERTSLYTGVRVAEAEQGTSISMGYMAESYIDFGPIGMFAPIFLLGLFYGLLYRGFIFWSRFKVIGFAAATSVILFSAYNFETSNIKLVGGMATCAIVAAVFLVVAEKPLAGLIGLRRSPGR